jgi:hypothetical protein
LGRRREQGPRSRTTRRRRRSFRPRVRTLRSGGWRQRAAAARDRHLQHLGPEALAVAVGAAQVHVGQELHLDVLEAVAAAGRAPAGAGVAAEGARLVAALARKRQLRVQVADHVERADVARRVGARRAADRRLVDEHRIAQRFDAAQRAMRAGRLGRLAARLLQRRHLPPRWWHQALLRLLLLLRLPLQPTLI